VSSGSVCCKCLVLLSLPQNRRFFGACVSVCLSVCLPTCLSVCLSACLAVCLSVFRRLKQVMQCHLWLKVTFSMLPQNRRFFGAGSAEEERVATVVEPSAGTQVEMYLAIGYTTSDLRLPTVWGSVWRRVQQGHWIDDDLFIRRYDYSQPRRWFTDYRIRSLRTKSWVQLGAAPCTTVEQVRVAMLQNLRGRGSDETIVAMLGERVPRQGEAEANAVEAVTSRNHSQLTCTYFAAMRHLGCEVQPEPEPAAMQADDLQGEEEEMSSTKFSARR
jgi:hypothetical protein